MNSPLQKPRTIEKPWGNELWIADGVRTPYALKRILFKAGKRSSLQVHKFKFETNYVLEGTGTSAAIQPLHPLRPSTVA